MVERMKVANKARLKVRALAEWLEDEEAPAGLTARAYELLSEVHRWRKRLIVNDVYGRDE